MKPPPSMAARTLILTSIYLYMPTFLILFPSPTSGNHHLKSWVHPFRKDTGLSYLYVSLETIY